MKKSVFGLLPVLSVLLLAACSVYEVPSAATVETEIQVTMATETTEATEATEEMTHPPETEATQPQPTELLHSALYIPGVPVDDVILYFNEVCLDAEIINSGNPTRLQKWTSSIEYFLFGNYTSEDLTVFNRFVQWLNELEGFPGMREAETPDSANLSIFFCREEEMVSLLGEHFYGMDGAMTFWYEYNEIYDGVICYRTDIDQYTRNSVILEEIYNCLGPAQDTELRSDSIIYSEFSQPQYLTEMDAVILKLLYNPLMACGMDAQACAEVIRQLYY